jgi:peptidoglycan/LPS O-acetylase OafA/YrhL
MIKERNLNYDLMRLLGLLIIMIAHASPPGWLFQLRNFGTPLLVVGSGLTYALVFSSKPIDVKKFYSKRLKRLIIPAWIFLSFFFLFYLGVSELIDKEYPFSIKQMLSSYLFMDGIGFVWVFKIYLMLALITPIALYLNNRVKNDRFYFGSLLVMYCIYELLNHVIQPHLFGVIDKLFNSVVFILLPYSILYLFSFRMARVARVNILICALSSFALFLALVYLKYSQVGSFVATQNFKYPPTLYYLSYAFFALTIAYLVITKLTIVNQYMKNTITWLSSNSLWIYLWHIFAFYIWRHLAPNPEGDMTLFIIKTVFLFGFGIILTMLQNRIVLLLSMKSQGFKNRLAPFLSSNT